MSEKKEAGKLFDWNTPKFKPIGFVTALIFASFTYGDEKIYVALIGGGGGQKIIQMENHKNQNGDLKLEASGYSFQPKSVIALQTGRYFGIEINSYQVRPYFGVSELLIGLNIRERIPLAYFGVAACPMIDLNGNKRFGVDGGFEVSGWLMTLAGVIQMSQRTMVQEKYQTRLDYIFKFPVFGERPRSGKNASSANHQFLTLKQN
jgi:hypothetical protein